MSISGAERARALATRGTAASGKSLWERMWAARWCYLFMVPSLLLLLFLIVLMVRLIPGNVVDLMSLFPPDVHPHGMAQQAFVDLFTADRPVIFAFHGYQRALHGILHGRPGANRFHVRGFNEQGTTTTPFDMVVLNEMSRFHLAISAIRRVPRLADRAFALIGQWQADIDAAVAYSREHFEDPPDIQNWIWSEP